MPSPSQVLWHFTHVGRVQQRRLDGRVAMRGVCAGGGPDGDVKGPQRKGPEGREVRLPGDDACAGSHAAMQGARGCDEGMQRKERNEAGSGKGRVRHGRADWQHEGGQTRAWTAAMQSTRGARQGEARVGVALTHPSSRPSLRVPGGLWQHHSHVIVTHVWWKKSIL